MSGKIHCFHGMEDSDNLGHQLSQLIYKFNETPIRVSRQYTETVAQLAVCFLVYTQPWG